MKVKSYTGRSLPEAILKAKQEFGDNVILLESKEISPGRTKNKQGLVEITVSIDERTPPTRPWSPPVVSSHSAQATGGKSEQKAGNDFNKVISDILARKPKEISQEKKILDELSELRQEIKQLNQGKEEQSNQVFPEAYRRILDHMKEKGLGEEIAEMVIKRAYQFAEKGPEATDKEIIRACKNEMRYLFKPFDLSSGISLNGPRIILLVGATGVGKTTMAMKLAAHPKIFGKKEVAIVSTDPYGPSEALKAFSKMNGTTILEKKRLDELQEVLEKLNKYDVVLVDTPGQSPFASHYFSKMEEYVKILNPTDIFLVISMSNDLKDLFLSSAFFLLLKPNGIVLTKFDETKQAGKVFPIIKELNLPVAAMSEGKRIFIDILPGNVNFVIERIFERG